MEEITYAKYPFPAVETGDRNYEDGSAMYGKGDIAYCSGILKDGRPFLAEHYHSDTEEKEYLIVVLSAEGFLDMSEKTFFITRKEHMEVCRHQCFNATIQMELDEIKGNLLNTGYQDTVTDYLCAKGIVPDEGAVSLMYLAADKNDNAILVADYELTDLRKIPLFMKPYGTER